MNKIAEEHLQKILRFNTYFESGLKNHALFLPELIACQTINKLLQEQKYSAELASEIEEILKVVEAAPHYDGSGWLDYKLHLRALFRAQDGS